MEVQMDTSEEYIKMCDCPEIQEQMFDFEDGHNNDNSAYSGKIVDGGHLVWLPRQDQIQEMFKTAPFVLAGDFDKKMENYITGNPDNWSFEMLWLAFYMYECHQKVWNGKKWAS